MHISGGGRVRSGSGRPHITVTPCWGRILIIRNIGGVVAVTDIRVVHLHQDATGLRGDLEEALLQPGRGLIARPIYVDVVPPIGHFKRHSLTGGTDRQNDYCDWPEPRLAND